MKISIVTPVLILFGLASASLYGQDAELVDLTYRVDPGETFRIQYDIQVKLSKSQSYKGHMGSGNLDLTMIQKITGQEMKKRGVPVRGLSGVVESMTVSGKWASGRYSKSRKFTLRLPASPEEVLKSSAPTFLGQMFQGMVSEGIREREVKNAGPNMDFLRPHLGKAAPLLFGGRKYLYALPCGQGSITSVGRKFTSTTTSVFEEWHHVVEGTLKKDKKIGGKNCHVISFRFQKHPDHPKSKVSGKGTYYVNAENGRPIKGDYTFSYSKGPDTYSTKVSIKELPGK